MRRSSAIAAVLLHAGTWCAPAEASGPASDAPHSSAAPAVAHAAARAAPPQSPLIPGDIDPKPDAAPPAAQAPSRPAEPADTRPAPAVAAPGPQHSSRSDESVVRKTSANRVELHVDQMPIADVLRMLSAESRRNIVASTGVTGSVTANLYDVTLEEALDAVFRMNKLGYRVQDDFIFVYTQDELDAMRKNERRVVTQVFRLRYLGARDARELIQPLLSEVGKISVTPAPQTGLDSAGQAAASGGGSSGSSSSAAGASGGGTGGNDYSTADTLVVTDEIDRVRRMEALVRELDVAPRQVLIEATILRASLNETNSLGIDFTTLGGVDFAQVGSTSPAAQSITTGDLPTPELDNTTFTARTGFVGNVPGGGLTFGIIKNNVALFLRALEAVADTAVIANPKVLALNKQKGEVIVGRRDGYFTTTVTETAAIQTVEFLETGTQLIFRPFVLDDSNVRMEIHPKDSTGGLTPSNLPFEQTTEVTTNILVRDGHTILIGGLFREVNTANRSQLPLLGNIPVAGALFRSSEDTTIREEVIILLTVRIVKGEPEEREGLELADDVERYRLGMRRGMLPIGRERLAQAHYRWALEHLAAGRTAMAAWDARMAVHNSPRFVPAIELIEQIERRRLWDEDASSVRLHLQRMIASDEGIELRDFGRPGPNPVEPDSTGAAPTEAEPRQTTPAAAPRPRENALAQPVVGAMQAVDAGEIEAP